MYRHALCISLLLLLCAGCLVIPTPEHGLIAGRGQIEDADLSFLEIGKTTRQDLLLRLGEPDLISKDESKVYYHWQVIHGYWAAGGPYQAVGGVIPKAYVCLFEFDADGRLERYEKTGSIWKDLLASPGEEKKPSTTFLIDPVAATVNPMAAADDSRPAVRFRVGQFSSPNADSNDETLAGYKIAAFGVKVAEVRTMRPAADMVRRIVIDQLQAAGNVLVMDDADLEVTGRVTEFRVSSQINLQTWDALGSLDVNVEFTPVSTGGGKLSRQYRATKVSGKLLGPDREDFELVMRRCLEELQSQMRNDADLTSFLDTLRHIPEASLEKEPLNNDAPSY